MTTQAENLMDRLPGVPIRVQRHDRTVYMEHEAGEVIRLVQAGVVEGVGPRSGRIAMLRFVVTDDEAVKRMAALPIDRTFEEKAGSITSAASREVYRQRLEVGWCWAFKRPQRIFA